MGRQKNYMIQLGVFVTAGLMLFIAGFYYLGNSKNLFGETISIYADFQNVKGLQSGNNVRFSGINVGSINDIKIINDSTLRVNMLIQQKVKKFIKKDAIASIGTDGLVGSSLVNISPGKSILSPIEDNDVIQSYSNVETDRVLQTLGTTSENIALLSLNLLEVTEKINKGEGSLGALLNDATLAKDIQRSVQNVKKTSANLVIMSDELNKTVAALQDGKGLLGYLLTDSTLVTQVENIITRVDTVIEKQIEPVFAGLQKSAEEINQFTIEINKVVEDINAGKGAVGTLLKDEETGLQMQEILKNVNESTIKLNENMEALRHNWFFKKYFKKKAKAEKKKQKELGKIDLEKKDLSVKNN